MNLLTLLFAISYSSVNPTTFYTNYYTPENTDHAIIYSGNLNATFDPNTLDLFVSGMLTPIFSDSQAAPEFNKDLFITEHQQYSFISDSTDQPFLELQLTDNQNVIMSKTKVPSISTLFAPDLSAITLICNADTLYKGSWLELGNSVYLKEVPEPASLFYIMFSLIFMQLLCIFRRTFFVSKDT